MKKTVLLALGIGLFLAAALTPAAAATVSATVFSVTGPAESAPPGSASFSPMTKGQILPVGTTIRTGDNGGAVVNTTPGSAIRIGPNTNLKLNALAFAKSGSDVIQRQTHIDLQSGVISALIDPSTPKVTDFRIETPSGAAAARGTFYGVAVVDGKTYVSVKEGKVGVGAEKPAATSAKPSGSSNGA